MTDEPRNPVQIEQEIRENTNEQSRGVRIVSDRYEAYLKAEREFVAAYSQAFLAHDGPQTEKRYAADAATSTEREARDVADVAHRYAKDRARVLEGELSANQTVLKSLMAQYQAAGVGER